MKVLTLSIQSTRWTTPSDIQQLRGPLAPRRERHSLLQRQALVQGDRAHDQSGAWQVIHYGSGHGGHGWPVDPLIRVYIIQNHIDTLDNMWNFI